MCKDYTRYRSISEIEHGLLKLVVNLLVQSVERALVSLTTYHGLPVQ